MYSLTKNQSHVATLCYFTKFHTHEASVLKLLMSENQGDLIKDQKETVAQAEEIIKGGKTKPTVNKTVKNLEALGEDLESVKLVVPQTPEVEELPTDSAEARNNPLAHKPLLGKPTSKRIQR